MGVMVTLVRTGRRCVETPVQQQRKPDAVHTERQPGVSGMLWEASNRWVRGFQYGFDVMVALLFGSTVALSARCTAVVL